MSRFLETVENWGNKLPHPTALFIWLWALVIVASGIFSALGLSAVASNGDEIVVKSLMSRDGIHYFLTHTVSNFVTFAPVGAALVAIMGLGIAEHSGLLPSVLKSVVNRTPQKLITAAIIFTGVLSSLAQDSGYVILIPLAAIVYIQAGKHPIAGIAAAFAGVSAGYSANLLVGPVDAILAGLSQEGAATIDPQYSVSIAGNYYFLIVSTGLITGIGCWVSAAFTSKQVQSIPYLPTNQTSPLSEKSNASIDTRKGLVSAGWVFISITAIILLTIIPSNGLLRSADSELLKSPFTQGIVVIIAFSAALCGIAFGLASGTYKTWQDCIPAMEKNIGTMASYLVLMFFAAQFVSFFNWSQLGLIIAVSGANALKTLNLPLPMLLVAFVFVSAFINLFIGSASAKWALLAPIFVPMFMLLGLTPEATQMAYRIGDSSTNIITPLMPYFGIVIAFMHKYSKDMGSGTVISLMLPYSIALLTGWTLVLFCWLLLDIPLGPGIKAFLP